MGIFDRFKKPTSDKNKKVVSSIKIQASEGSNDEVLIESMLTGRRLNFHIPGTANAYNSYDSQVWETYNKYNSFADFGTQQTKAVIDLRTAFIAGEGISVSCENEQTSEFIENFIKKNDLDGLSLFNSIKGSEMSGQALFNIVPKLCEDEELIVKLNRYPYRRSFQYRPLYSDLLLMDEVIDVMIKKDFGEVSAQLRDFIYVRTGGDDTNSYGPVTKTGSVLTDIENYDRALKDIRRTNHILARITPSFKTQTANETKGTIKLLNEMQWTIGKAFVGTAEMDYKTPGSGAHNNLIIEMVATIKTISAVTGVPVHWLGYVDLMSNRSTADSMYETIKNATSVERIIWEKALYKMILKAQEVYIDNGGGIMYNKDFQVRLPLIRFEDFLSLIRGLNIAFGDNAISMSDYRNAITGIDPIQTEKAVKVEKEKEVDALMSLPIQPNNIKKDDNNGGKDE